MEVQERIQKTTFINEHLTPSESQDVINGIFDCYINFMKLQHLSHWEKDHSIGSNGVNQKVAKLQAIKEELKEQIQEARMQGKLLKFKGNITLELI